MAELNLDYFQNDSGYSDGGFEAEIADMIKTGKEPEEILKEDNRWEVYYHLTPKRENILNWYDFKEGSRILEVGSGCGALTGLLCRKGGEVISVELTLPRAKVNYERNKEYENLKVLVGNFNNMVFDQKFDYIILNGVLEYAASFTDTKHPYEDFLERLRGLLTEDGKILIAIENRFGLKYFNGVPEDHTGFLYVGISGYNGIDFVKTFSKPELKELLEKAGFKDINFYYPTPDYKIPQVIYTDKSMDMMTPFVDERIYNFDRLHLFDESEVMKMLLDENIADRFQNSFLVEASPKKIEKDENIIYAKASDNRKKEYQVLTVITENADGIRQVYKSPLYEEGKEHLEKMLEYYKNNPNNGRFTNVPVRKEGDTLVFDYIEGPTFQQKLLKLLENNDKDAFEEAIKNFAAEILEGSEIRSDYYQGDFIKAFGPEALKDPLHVKSDVNIDIIFTNIIEGDKETVIDYEWIMDFPIPMEYVIWRSLYYFYYISNLHNYGYSLEDLVKLAGIDPKYHEIFVKWDEHFGNDFIAGVSDEDYTTQIIDAQPMIDAALKEYKSESTLYLDFGLGNFEEASIRKRLIFDDEKTGRFHVTYDIAPFIKREEGRLQNLRWDPIEYACCIEDIKITNDGDEELALDISRLKPEEGSEKDGAIYFFTNDPNTDIVGNYSGIGTITVSGVLRPMNGIEAKKAASEIAVQKNKKSKKIKKLKKRLYERDAKIKELERKLKKLEQEE